jgi:hypothetical protein
MGPPEGLVLALQKRLALGEFVETGTYRGETAAWAARHFARVTTIELSPSFHAAAQARFQAEPRVRALGGGSVAVLREVVPALAGPAVFWLDAHWSGLDTAGREAECPVLDEIATIDASPHDHVVLVDDARLFCAPPPRPHRADHWPNLATLTARLVAGGRRHVVLSGDVFVAVPAAEREFLTAFLQDAAAEAAPPGTGWLARWKARFRS